jgi:hypothetical protein
MGIIGKFPLINLIYRETRNEINRNTGIGFVDHGMCRHANLLRRAKCNLRT